MCHDATVSARLITDRFEWQRLAGELATSPYHHPGWSWAAVRRIRQQTSKPVGCAYARIWHDDTLIGCPVITLGAETFNSPRTWPQILTGPKLSDRQLGAVVTGALNQMTLSNDEAQLVAIRSVARRLARLSVDTRVFASVTGDDLAAITAAVPWSGELRRNQWLGGLVELARTSWDMHLIRHLDAHCEILGWSATIAFDGRADTVVTAAAVQVGVEPPQWASLR
jgi:hypothetical protein